MVSFSAFGNLSKHVCNNWSQSKMEQENVCEVPGIANDQFLDEFSSHAWVYGRVVWNPREITINLKSKSLTIFDHYRPSKPFHTTMTRKVPKLPKMPRIAQNWPALSKNAQNCQKLPRIDQIAQNSQICPKCPELTGLVIWYICCKFCCRDRWLLSLYWLKPLTALQ